ncbi:MAG TPA: CDP-archaeol synthase [Verrucomicrobiales bacterium]|nr:CDP-archaeol synthase [Verrucomicrobiales bacterium]
MDSSDAPDPRVAGMNKGGSPSRKKTFFLRLTSTLVLWALVVGGLVLNWSWLAFTLIALVAVLALLECLRLFGVERHPALHHWTVGIGVLYLSATFLYSRQENVYFAHLDIFFVVLHIFGAFVVTLFRPLSGRETLERLTGAVFAFLYIPFFFNFLIRILYLDSARELSGGNGSVHLLFLVVTTKFTDMGAYVIGSWRGKHPAAPSISPGKTWEGFGGAFLGALVGAIGVLLLFRGRMFPVTPPHAVYLALLLAVAAILGDLAESLLKRCAKVKDSGNMLPGIGGALDLIDSLCFTAPVLYLYLNLLLDGGHATP